MNEYGRLENVFGIDKPEMWNSKILLYSIGHRSMKIEVRNISNRAIVELSLGRVMYFSGFTEWESANFCRESSEDYLTFINRYSPFSDIADADLLASDTGYQLLTVSAKSREIKILARHLGRKIGKDWETIFL